MLAMVDVARYVYLPPLLPLRHKTISLQHAGPESTSSGVRVGRRKGAKWLARRRALPPSIDAVQFRQGAMLSHLASFGFLLHAVCALPSAS